MEKFWLKHYPPGVPAEVDVDQYSSLVQLMEDGFAKYAQRNAYAYMDRLFTFAEIDRSLGGVRRLAAGLGASRAARASRS